MNEHMIRPIAHIESDFPEKFGIPRQAGVVEELRARVVFDQPKKLSFVFCLHSILQSDL